MHLFDKVNIYADICSNHNGDPKVYDQLVHGIQDAGAIVKIQLHSPKTFDRDWDLPDRWVPSVFRLQDVDWAMTNNPLALKIASVESTYFNLVRHCMETGLPLLISTGGMDLGELVALCELIDPYSGNVCLMHCVSMYPTPMEHANMIRISVLADLMEDMLLQPYVGWSSHHVPEVTKGLFPMALAYDANQIEVHVNASNLLVPKAATPDFVSSVDLSVLAHLSAKAMWLAPAFGEAYDEDYIPQDRANVLEWRKRWQKETQ